jgi:cell division protein ZapA
VKASPEGLRLSVMGREFAVACNETDKPLLLQAAAELDRRMREVQKSGKVIGLDRCAIIAALNVTYDLLQARHESAGSSANSARLRAMRERIDAALQDQQQLNL